MSHKYTKLEMHIIPLLKVQLMMSLIHNEKNMYWTKKHKGIYYCGWYILDTSRLSEAFEHVSSCIDLWKYVQNKTELFPTTWDFWRYIDILDLLCRVAYFEHEREEIFSWALEELNELITSRKLISKTMVIDQELALMNTICFVLEREIIEVGGSEFWTGGDDLWYGSARWIFKVSTSTPKTIQYSRWL